MLGFLSVSPEAIVAAAGLGMDMAGIIVLFFKTSPGHIEADISVRLVEAFTPGPGEEWLHSISPAEHQRELKASRRRVMRTHLWLRVGLVLILLGFTCQAVALFI